MSAPTVAAAPTEAALGRRLLQGSEAIAEAMIAAGCRFFAGYPMTPFTEVLEEMAKKLPAVGGVCMNAESELEAVGMAWGAAATGTPAATGSTGQGLSLMQESLAEISLARLPLVVLNMARAQGDYWQTTRGGGHGDYRHVVLAPADVAEAVELVQRAFHLSATWRNPVVVLGDYYLAHTARAVDVTPLDLGPPPARDWALTGESGGSGRAKLVSFLGSVKQRDGVGYDLAVHYEACAAHTARMLREVPAEAETGGMEDAEVVVVAFGTPGAYVRAAVRSLRAEGVPVGFVRPVTLVPFPSDVIAAGSAAGQGGRRLREQHRADARRRAPGRAGRRPGRIHRGPESRLVGLRHRPRPRGVRGTPAHPRRTGAPPVSEHPRMEVVPTDAPPSVPARLVDDFTPALVDVGAHQLCPGCGEPIAVRSLVEAIDELALAQRTIAVFGIGCYTAFSNNLDVEVLQALHGRAPSVATGVKRARPDTVVVTVQGDGDMVSEGLAEVLHAAARGENITCVMLNNGVFGETGGHMTATTVLGQRTKTSLEGRDPVAHGRPILLADLISRLDGAAYVARCAVNSAGALARTHRALSRALDTQLAGVGFSFVEILTMCPTGWFVETTEAPRYLAENLGAVHRAGVLKDVRAKADAESQ